MITHKGTQTIYTERLVLRRFTVDDAQAMYDNWANDERVCRFLSWQPHESAEATKQLLESWCKAYENDSTYNWAMEYDGTVIGSISVVEIKERHERAELGYCMGYAYWNKGIMSEAAKAVIDYLFKEVGVNRIDISHAVKNPASGRVAQNAVLLMREQKENFSKLHRENSLMYLITVFSEVNGKNRRKIKLCLD